MLIATIWLRSHNVEQIVLQYVLPKLFNKKKWIQRQKVATSGYLCGYKKAPNIGLCGVFYLLYPHIHYFSFTNVFFKNIKYKIIYIYIAKSSGYVAIPYIWGFASGYKWLPCGYDFLKQ